MLSDRQQIWGRAAFLGFLSGLRSGASVAGLSFGGAYGDLPGLKRTRFRILTTRGGMIGAVVALVGEMIGDKLPATPARTNPAPLIGRAVAGAIAGVGIFAANDEAVAAGAAIGATAAVAGTFGGYYARRSLTKGLGLPDLPVALVEDALVLGGITLFRRRPALYIER